MKILSILQNLTQLGKSKEEVSKEITSIEAGYLWSTLLTKYDIIERSQLYLTLARDQDFKIVIGKGLDFLKDEADLLERQAKKFGIALPVRPPAYTSVNVVDVVEDRYIFHQILMGMRGALATRMASYIESTTTNIRAIFLDHLAKEIELYDGFFEYGKIKGWVSAPPIYRP